MRTHDLDRSPAPDFDGTYFHNVNSMTRQTRPPRGRLVLVRRQVRDSRDEGVVALADFTYEEVGRILRALERLDCDSVHLECGDLKLDMTRGTAPPAAAPPTAEPEPRPAAPEVTHAEPEAGTGDAQANWVSVSAPMVGTFYRAPEPGKPPYVEPGDPVRPGQTVGVLEVMKLFTEVKAEVEGKVARVDADDAALVESGQPLIWIEPA